MGVIMQDELVSYVSCGPGTSLHDIEDDVSCTLPQHMVPTTWIKLPALPHMPNGKLDRHALPEPGW